LFGRVAGRIIGYAAFLGKYRIVATPGAIEYGMPDLGPNRCDGHHRRRRVALMGPVRTREYAFTYFEDPEKNLLEWVTEIQQIDEISH
jgi:hypothetical protein